MSPRATRGAVLLQSDLPALLLLLAFDSASKASADHDAELTQAEQRLLESGELVTRPARKRSGPLDLIGGVSWQVIDAAPAVVWRALHDVARYPKMVPGVIEARTQSVADTQRMYQQQPEAFVAALREFLDDPSAPRARLRPPTAGDEVPPPLLKRIVGSVARRMQRLRGNAEHSQ